MQTLPLEPTQIVAALSTAGGMVIDQIYRVAAVRVVLEHGEPVHIAVVVQSTDGAATHYFLSGSNLGSHLTILGEPDR